MAQQQSSITGRVISATEQTPVAGATLRLLNGQTIFLSDKNGNFTITLPVAFDTVIVTHIGFMAVSQRITSGEAAIVIAMEPVAAQMQEVTVETGYQRVPKERQTGSFEKINSRLLNQQAGTDILSRLKGVSTLLFDNNINRPALTVRGLSSINGPKSPLIVLDNFPYEGNIENINPNDVESITILKDAAAASIWGTRAGNGVIVITTKKGQFNQPARMEITSNITLMSKPGVRHFETINSGDFIDVEQYLFSKGFYNNQETNANRPALTPVVELLIAKRDGRMPAAEADARIEQLRYHDVRDEYNNYMYRQGVNQQYNVSVRGGSANNGYSLAAGFDKNINTLAAVYERRTLRAGNTMRLFRNLQVNTAISYTESKTRSGRPAYESFLKLYPYAQFKSDDGNPMPVVRTYRQAYIDTAGGGRLLNWNYYPSEDYKHNTTAAALQDIVVNLELQYRLVKNLALDVKYQYEKQQAGTSNQMGIEGYFTRDMINRFSQLNSATGVVTYPVPKGDILDQAIQTKEMNAVRAQLNFETTAGRNTITAIGGMETRQVKNNSGEYRVYGYNDDVLTTSNVDFVNPFKTYVTGTTEFIPSKNAFSSTINKFISLYTNAAYTYNGLYTLSASARKDASNLFGVQANDKWQPLWSTGFSWNISKETFYNLKALPLFKARFTYGLSGNADPARSAVTTLSFVSLPAMYTNLQYANVNQYKNTGLRWEKVRMINAAIDFALHNNVLYGSIEFYRKKGTDLFGLAPLDYTTGLGTRNLMMNIAAIKGSGIDAILNSSIVNKKVKWTATLLAAYSNMRVSSYFLNSSRGGDYVSNGSIITPLEGKPVYSVLSYKWAGLDSAGNPQGIVGGKISTDFGAITGNETGVHDMVYSGPALPPLQGSLINTVAYKAWSISINVSYKLGYYYRRNSVNYTALFNQWSGHADFAKRWQKPGDELISSIPSMTYPNNSSRDDFYSNSEVLVSKADNIRLQYVNISYDVDRSTWRKLPLQHIQIFINSANTATLWRAYKSGIDPDFGTIPPPRSITIGLRAAL